MSDNTNRGPAALAWSAWKDGTGTLDMKDILRGMDAADAAIAEAEAKRDAPRKSETKLAWLLDEAISLNDWSDDLGCLMTPGEVALMLLGRWDKREGGECRCDIEMVKS